MRTLFTACFVSLLFSFSAMAAIDVYEFDNDQQEQQFKELSQTLRCPKCQNNTISDSNAELAKDLRSKVYEMTKQGKSSDEIVDYMVDRYGNFVTYNPPLTFATSVLWLGPLLVVVIGFGLIVVNSRRKSAKAAQKADWDKDKEQRLEALLKEDANGEKQ
ncbi:cystathionine gamma-synthase [Vibrio sp. MACH09]|uniref:cytochrome c-type biogenesis protein n=1 Tax=unclassified Vibrio TaxID=2614977 RepID=UPI001493465C|nr:MULTISPECIES: cytochrome c-type biogenesis protein [unclassified Vibrio]NOI65588.1 cytochrome c-type biogenesis protein CcmH [Vibrio sp. 99-8-1]GLO61524.1 cystathionine gamma-synthase [Vibrio sp. MACH09]